MHAFHIACWVLVIFFGCGALRRTWAWWHWASNEFRQHLFQEPSGAMIRWLAMGLAIIGANA